MALLTDSLVDKIAAAVKAVVREEPEQKTDATPSPPAEATKEAEKKDEKSKDDAKKDDEKDKAPSGMLTESKSLYQKKDTDGKFQWVNEEPEDAVDAAENSETAKFAFLVRNKKSYDSRKKYEIDSIIIQSPLLKKSLGIVLENYTGVTTALDRLVFRAPFQPFVHRWRKLTELLEQTEDETAKNHLQLLYDVLYAELKDAINAKNDLVKNGVITFEFLWTIFEPGTLVYGVDPLEGKERLYELHSTSRALDQKRGVEYLRISSRCVDWDGEKFGTGWEYLSDYEFEGTKLITSLAAFPLQFHPQKKELEARLIARGKLFEKFAGYHYKAYQGVALGYSRCGLIKHNVDSRIIIDCEAHNRFIPNQAVYFNALGKGVQAEIETAGDDDEVPESEADNDDDDSSESEEYIYTPQSGDDTAGDKPTHRPLTTRELLTSVPFVRGYAMKSKIWLIFFVDQVRPIQFSANAFSSLVLPSAQKELIKAFVQSQVKYKDSFDDVIAGKGRGMIMLLSGPPGVGKTLTAESVAEDMRVPLYMMSAGDLGLDPASIESSLNTVLEMVAKWNAVLLLDEADVFLEARSTDSLERNKMVSIFLRMLEYYEGILFLTTNRVNNIDDAFHSRIHVSMRYPNLTKESRRHIWTAFVGQTAGLTSAQLDKLAEVELNGRQIKNVLKTAQMLTRHKHGDAKVGMQDIETILAIERGKVFT